MSTIEFAVYSQDGHNYLSNVDTLHMSFRPSESGTGLYADTDLICQSWQDAQLIGYVIVPAGSSGKLSVSRDGEERLSIDLPGWPGLRLDASEAYDWAHSSDMPKHWRLGWRAAPAQ